ncbi:NUDIX domain-containing protein [Jeotgalibacillus sp. ET6]|uniref:NUDIX hydrolase n=1 Tax=Jeotgalibacillus sp. ET6 TaxID=3037260 RepID=UPI00241899F8|nr:NUDIX domain-containing protein [Jeotgalibacillus sp. ET6]MDG5471937.1 NUDIX domain-containing protein [Jeotgalibacillus sp. ET6]
MEEEQLSIFNEKEEKIGVLPRNQVHAVGALHETFHCWLIRKSENQIYLYFQLRSPEKKDFPSLLDITAAGHLSSSESVEDGTRELEEELGVKLPFTSLQPLGTVKEKLKNGLETDAEICRVFSFEITQEVEFTLQDSEVKGLFQVELDAFEELMEGKKEGIWMNGFEESQNGRYNVDKFVNKKDFVPHQQEYYHFILKKIKNLYSYPQ